MTVATETSRIAYTGSGSAGPFAVPFYFLADADLKVVKTLISTGAESTLALTTDYTVTGAGAAAGGEVTLTAALSALYTISIIRDAAALQSVDYQANDKFPAETHERALDKLTMLIQRLKDRLGRVIRQPDGDTVALSEIPAAAARANSTLGFDSTGQVIVGAVTGTIVSAAMTPVVQAATVIAGRAALGMPAFTSGEIHIGGATPDYMFSARFPSRGASIINGKIVRSVAASALTLSLKTLTGADPSAADPVLVRFPTITGGVLDGGYVIRVVTAALSLVISSGSTLGHMSAVASAVYTYLGDNAGVVVLGASSKFFGGASAQSSTAEGGAGAADTATTLYAASALTIAWACVDRWKSTQATAGTWALTTGEVQLYPFPYKAPKVTRFTAATTTFTKDWDTLWLDTYIKGAGGSGGGSTTAANGGGGGEGEEGWGIYDQSAFPPSLTVAVGVGGAAIAAGTNASGNSGGVSALGGFFGVYGGTGGASGNVGCTPGIGGSAGGGGDLHMAGCAGTPGGDTGGVVIAIYGAGGGKGGGQSAVAGVANTGGGGGGGSAVSASGAGANGVSLITEHYFGEA